MERDQIKQDSLAEIDELKAKLAQVEDENRHLNQQISFQISSFLERLENSLSRINDLESELNTSRHDCENLECENVKFKFELESKIEEIESAKAAWNSDNELLARLKSANAEVEARLVEKSAEQQLVNAELESCKRENERLKSQCETESGTVQLLLSQTGALNKTAENVSKECDALKNLLIQAQRDSNEKESQMSGYLARIGELTELVTETERRNIDLQAQNFEFIKVCIYKKTKN